MSRLTLASYITLIHTLNKPSSFCNEFQQLCVIFSVLLNNLRKSLEYLKQSPFFRTTVYCRRSSNRSVVAEKWSVSAVDEQLQKTSEDPGNGNTVVMRHDYELVTKTKRPTSNVWKVLANTLLQSYSCYHRCWQGTESLGQPFSYPFESIPTPRIYWAAIVSKLQLLEHSS